MSLTGHKAEFSRDVAGDILTRICSDEGLAESTSRIAFAIAHATNSGSSCGPQKRAVLAVISKAIDAQCPSVFGEITLLQNELDRLSNPSDERWAVHTKKVHDKAHVIFADLFRQVGADIGITDLSFTRASAPAGDKRTRSDKLSAAAFDVKEMGSLAFKERLPQVMSGCVRDLVAMSMKTLSGNAVREMFSFANVKEAWPKGALLADQMKDNLAYSNSEREFQANFTEDIVGLVKFLCGAEEQEK
jgi:hypothetical protein